MVKISLSLFLGTLILSCAEPRRESPVIRRVSESKVIIPKADQKLYDVVKFIIEEQKLNRSYAINIAPLKNISQEDDEYYLMGLLIKARAEDITTQKIAALDSFHYVIDIPPYDFRLKDCLMKEDVDYMLHQKKKRHQFVWDGTALGFNAKNSHSWYSISVPLFSVDSSKVLVGVQFRCDQFMCGNEVDILLTKVDGKWESRTGPVIVH
jgi:hypothetical protein